MVLGAQSACRRLLRPLHTVAGDAMRDRMPSISGVLDYLDRCRRFASLSRNRDMEQHYEALWRFVFTASHGELPRMEPFRMPAYSPEPLRNQPIPKWKQQVLERPMRKVVRHWEVDVWSRKPGVSYAMRRLLLSCGHILDEFPISTGVFAPQRRRCRVCADTGRKAPILNINRKAGR